MFLIVSTGRCGTVALCSGFAACSDHEMAHEVPPRLLEEAWRKHQGLDYQSTDFDAKMRMFNERQDSCYGEAFRGCTLLSDVAEAAPRARFLVLVRDPLEYVRSAHFMKVLNQGGSIWDTHRVMPHDDDQSLPLAVRLASHWMAVNRYLLDFAEQTVSPVHVALHGDLDANVDAWAQFAGVHIADRPGLSDVLSTKPNSSRTFEEPGGFDADQLRAQTAEMWDRAVGMAGRARGSA